MKPREWWIRQLRNVNPTYGVSTKPYAPGYQAVHVIDKSAYDKAIETLKQIFEKNDDGDFVTSVAHKTLSELGEY